MATHTDRSRAALDRGFEEEIRRRFRAGYQRLYATSDRVEKMPVGHVLALARTYAILSVLASVDFDSCLDVGAGEGRLAHLIGRLYGARCAGVELSTHFARGARDAFGIPVYVADGSILPFADNSFDLVLCSEVIEHVEHPLTLLAELDRVARRAVLLTTQEVSRKWWHRRLQMAAAEREEPHAERNYFLYDDFPRLLGRSTEVYATVQTPERIRLWRRGSVAELKACVRALVGNRRIRRGSFGVIAVARKLGSAVPPRAREADILDAVIDTDRRQDEVLARRFADPTWGPPPADIPTFGNPPPVCTECGGNLSPSSETLLRCHNGGHSFRVECGVPILLGSADARAARGARWAARPELEAVRRALRQHPLRPKAARTALRAALKLGDFALSPLAWKEKARLARLVLSER